MDVDTLITHGLGEPPKHNAEGGAWIDVMFEMWRACRQWMPAALRISDAERKVFADRLAYFTSGAGNHQHMTYGGGKPLCSLTSAEIAALDLEGLDLRRALWDAICAVLDAPDEAAMDAASHRFMDVMRVDGERPAAPEHCTWVDAGSQLGRFTYPSFTLADRAQVEKLPQWRRYLESVWYPYFAPGYARERWEKERGQ